ncbi:universal stress protein [Xanthobacter dioxanivorans]|uniref:Universal stress protein n=1 Tax=Xanthobacter dioxanivorans TaxID=2528964 RepID=A0A974SJ49_9HYPH|nr:universal stress protein [Xanthobacter dioxanivorans]QRG08036.1 universal stress protein [Xanthobacter dioxanivorans]
MIATRQSHEPGHRRKFLVVVDDTPECDRAVYYASRRAAGTEGGLVLLGVLELEGVAQQWLGVADLMRAEAHEEMEARLEKFVARARQVAGLTPECVIREGEKAEIIAALIHEDRDIAILVLAAGVGKEGPGPLVSSLAAGRAASFPIPVTIVPGALTDAELDALA